MISLAKIALIAMSTILSGCAGVAQAENDIYYMWTFLIAGALMGLIGAFL